MPPTDPSEDATLVRATATLERAEARLKAVVDNAPLVVWTIDAAGTFTLSEGRGLQALGLAPGQVVGASAFDIYRDLPDIAHNLRRGLQGEQFIASAQVGELCYETIHLPQHDADGRVVGLMGISTDVTERKQAEVRHAALQAQLLHVQKLESLGVLAGGIAHDFNNLLTAILGGVSVAALQLPPENPAQDALADVMSTTRRAADLTRQLLAYSGKGQFEVRAIDLSALVRELARLLETSIPKKVQLRLELAGGLPAIEADVAQIQQVVMNLVINGAEAIGDQTGTVLVTTAVHDIDELYAGSLFTAGEIEIGRYVYLEVHDTGSGMDEATKEKIFDPFFTTKLTGRGLGLAAVLGIVRGHKGAIKIYSSIGRGSTFKVFFPATTKTVQARRDEELDQFRGSGLVLVIDDDTHVRISVRRLLEFFGYDVVEAADGREGVRVFTEHAADLHLVLLDMTMPVMSGEETFRELRRIRSDVPVILSSGYNEIEATRRFVSKGLAGFLQKPFTPKDLARCIVAAVGARGPAPG